MNVNSIKSTNSNNKIKKIYTIMTMEKLKVDKNDFPKFGNSRIVGWYQYKEDAFKVVKENICDINETIYDYVLIEEIEEGLNNPALNRWFFKYNNDTKTYIQIDEPKKYKHYCGFTIG